MRLLRYLVLVSVTVTGYEQQAMATCDTVRYHGGTEATSQFVSARTGEWGITDHGGSGIKTPTFVHITHFGLGGIKWLHRLSWPLSGPGGGRWEIKRGTSVAAGTVSPDSGEAWPEARKQKRDSVPRKKK